MGKGAAVSLYSRYVLPRMIDWAMSSAETARVRAELIPRAQGVTLEIGIGSGLNLPFYSSRVTPLYGVDSSPELHAIARKRAEVAAPPRQLFLQSPEEWLPRHD